MEFTNNKIEKQTLPEQQFNEFYESIKSYLSEDGYGQYLCEGAVDVSLIASTDYENPGHDELPFDMARKFIERYEMRVKNELRPVGDELVSIDMTKYCSRSILSADEKDGFLYDVLKLIKMGYNIKLNYRSEENLTEEEINDNKTEEVSKFNQISGWDLDNRQYTTLRDYYLLMNLEFPQDAIKDLSSGVLSMIDGSVYHGFEGDESYDFKIHIYLSALERALDDDLEIDDYYSEEVSQFNQMLNWDITNKQYDTLKEQYLLMNLNFPQDVVKDASSGIISIVDGNIHYNFWGDEYFDIDSCGFINEV